MKKLSILVSVLLVLALANCGGGAEEGAVNGGGEEEEEEAGGIGKIQGTVKDSGGNPIADATVSVAGASLSATTNLVGLFEIEGVTASDRVVLTAAASGYLSGAKTVAVTADQSAYAAIMLLDPGATKTITAGSGGTVTDTTSGAELTIDSGTMAMIVKSTGANGKTIITKSPVSGDVDVSVANLPPSSDAFPGFEAVSTIDSQEVSRLESFGAISCVVEQDGAEIDAEFTGTASVPIPSDHVSDAPDAIDFWAFNETSGLWEKTGTGTKTVCSGSPCYSGQVTHCSSWNADIEIESTCVHGTVVDENGAAVPNVEVVCTGKTYNGQDYATTDSNGEFDCYVKLSSTGEQFYAYARGISGNGPYSGPLNAPTVQLAPPNCEDIDSLRFDGETEELDWSQFTMLTWISASWYLEDLNLDLHITGPNGAHVYYGSLGSLVAEPYLLLSGDVGCDPPSGACMPGTTEEAWGYYGLPAGTYDVYVHRRDGSALPPVDENQIDVDAVVMNYSEFESSGENYNTEWYDYEYTYTTTDPGTNNVWHALQITVSSDGAVSMSVIDEYLTW